MEKMGCQIFWPGYLRVFIVDSQRILFARISLQTFGFFFDIAVLTLWDLIYDNDLKMHKNKRTNVKLERNGLVMVYYS